MTTRYFKEFSRELGREMEFKVFGDGGRLCLAFPPQDGRFYDFENFGMVDTLRPWLDSGRLLLVCVDSIDTETWSNEGGDPRRRIELHEKWFRYVTEELLPRTRELGPTTGKAVVTGCSMGGIHAANFFFRRPDLFDTVISLSGLYNADYFFHDYMDDLVYNNSPLHFLRNMPEDHPYMALYRSSQIILCVGQGAWEDDLLDGTRRMDALLQEKHIPAWVDYWGFDVCHDWCWWQKQLPYFFGKIMP
jgi:esterase/lipase superfamily enzyme